MTKTMFSPRFHNTSAPDSTNDMWRNGFGTVTRVIPLHRPTKFFCTLSTPIGVSMIGGKGKGPYESLLKNYNPTYHFPSPTYDEKKLLPPTGSELLPPRDLKPFPSHASETLSADCFGALPTDGLGQCHH